MKNYGIIRLRIEELLIEKNISKNKICKDLDIPRTNFNRYCRGEYQRLDTNLLCKLLVYFDCSPNDLIEHIKDGHVKDRRVKDGHIEDERVKDEHIKDERIKDK